MECQYWEVEEKISEEKLKDISKLKRLNDEKLLARSFEDELIFLTKEVESKKVEKFNHDVKNIEQKEIKIDENIESSSLTELDCKEIVESVKNSEEKEEHKIEKQRTEELNDMLNLKRLSKDKMLTGSSQDESISAVSTPLVAHLMKELEKEVEFKMVKLNQLVKNIESKHVKIDENMESRSLKDLDLQSYSYEINIKLNNSRDDLQNLENCDPNDATEIDKNSEEKKENEVEKQNSENDPDDVLDMKVSSEEKQLTLGDSSQNESTIKKIKTLVDQPGPNDLKIKDATKMVEKINHDIKNIESKNVKIDENIRARSLKDLDLRGYSYEVNIKLRNSRDDLQNMGYFDFTETIDFGENADRKKEHPFRTRLRAPEYQHKTGVPIPIQLPKPSQKLKNKSKTKKNKCRKVSNCCSFILNCLC